MSYSTSLIVFFSFDQVTKWVRYPHYIKSILSCMTECHVISLLFLTFYVLTVSHCTKKFHLFLITSDGNLDHLNCRAWVRAFGSGSLKLLCCLSVKLCLCLNAQNCCPLLFQQSNNRPPKNTSGRFYGTCLPLARHLPNFNQGDKKKGKLD